MTEYSWRPAAAATNIEDHADVVTNRTFDELSKGETASLVRLVSGHDIKLVAAVSADAIRALLDAEYAPTAYWMTHGF